MKWWKQRQQRARAGFIPTTFADPAIAAVKDEAVRVVLEEYRGRLAQLENTRALLQNQVDGLYRMMADGVVFQEGKNPYLVNRAIMEQAARESSDGGAPPL